MVDSLPILFSVRRHEPQLVVPAKPIPHELKPLSDIDDQEGLRFHVPVIMCYRNSPLMKGKDPVKVIKEGLAKALVFYYPFAGRLIEGNNRKLMVNCTGEGVLFIEADADIDLEQLGDAIKPPCPYLEELLFDVPGSAGIIDSPLLLIQVTRFTCGGFVFGIHINHTMCDGSGLVQFLNSIGEIAQGASSPSMLPVWHRELLNARVPPRITCIHHEYEEVVETKPMDENYMVQRSFFFGSKEIRALRNHLPSYLRTCSKFDVITACLWRCRTTALQLDPAEIVRISCILNARGKQGLDVPCGYYGNAFVYPAVISNAKMLCKNELGYAVELIKKAKDQMSEEYIRSVADLMVIKARPLYTKIGNFIVSDTTRLGFDEVDFGWGRPVFGGVARAISLVSFYVNSTNSECEDGILVPICLTVPVMKRFQQELEKMIQDPFENSTDIEGPIIASKL